VLILYSILVICTIMVLGAAVFCYRYVKRHMHPVSPETATPLEDVAKNEAAAVSTVKKG